jgi:magnesium chelatase subunit D
MNAVRDASWAASLFAVDPVGTGGVCLRSQVQPARDQWLQLVRELLVSGGVRRIPFNISDNRLLGGLDLVATLKANRPVAERGVLAASDGGVVVISMAERLTRRTAAYLCAVLDAGEAVLPREGVMLRHPARVGVIAVDEGLNEDEAVPICLLDRLAFLLDLNGFSRRAQLEPLHQPAQIRAAREMLAEVSAAPEVVESLCATALALGAGSVRCSLLAYRAARAAAALYGRAHVTEEDAILAARLVLAPRATMLPAPPEAAAEPARETLQPSPSPADAPKESPNDRRVGELEARVLAAAEAAIPPGLLMRLKAQAALARHRPNSTGRAGGLRNAGARGRPRRRSQRSAARRRSVERD